MKGILRLHELAAAHLRYIDIKLAIQIGCLGLTSLSAQ